MTEETFNIITAFGIMFFFFGITLSLVALIFIEMWEKK